jgi:hypothetical protein
MASPGSIPSRIWEERSETYSECMSGQKRNILLFLQLLHYGTHSRLALKDGLKRKIPFFISRLKRSMALLNTLFFFKCRKIKL